MSKTRGSVSLRLRQNPSEVHAPLGANFFHFSRLGDDIAFQVGWIPIPRVVEQLEAAQNAGLPPEVEVVAGVHHMYHLSPSGFIGFYRQMTEFVERLKKDQLFPPGALPETDD